MSSYRIPYTIGPCRLTRATNAASSRWLRNSSISSPSVRPLNCWPLDNRRAMPRLIRLFATRPPRKTDAAISIHHIVARARPFLSAIFEDAGIDEITRWTWDAFGPSRRLLSRQMNGKRRTMREFQPGRSIAAELSPRAYRPVTPTAAGRLGPTHRTPDLLASVDETDARNAVQKVARRRMSGQAEPSQCMLKLVDF